MTRVLWGTSGPLFRDGTIQMLSSGKTSSDCICCGPEPCPPETCVGGDVLRTQISIPGINPPDPMEYSGFTGTPNATVNKFTVTGWSGMAGSYVLNKRAADAPTFPCQWERIEFDIPITVKYERIRLNSSGCEDYVVQDNGTVNVDATVTVELYTENFIIKPRVYAQGPQVFGVFVPAFVYADRAATDTHYLCPGSGVITGDRESGDDPGNCWPISPQDVTVSIT